MILYRHQETVIFIFLFKDCHFDSFQICFVWFFVKYDMYYKPGEIEYFVIFIFIFFYIWYEHIEIQIVQFSVWFCRGQEVMHYYAVIKFLNSQNFSKENVSVFEKFVFFACLGIFLPLKNLFPHTKMAPFPAKLNLILGTHWTLSVFRFIHVKQLRRPSTYNV